jgi:hypothetical protein
VIPPPVNANPLPASAACSTRQNEISSVPVENLRETSIETSPTSREEEQSLKNQSISNSFSSLSTFIKPRDVWRAIYKLEKVHGGAVSSMSLKSSQKPFSINMRKVLVKLTQMSTVSAVNSRSLEKTTNHISQHPGNSIAMVIHHQDLL